MRADTLEAYKEAFCQWMDQMDQENNQVVALP